MEAATFPDGIRTGRIRVELPDNERGADFLDNMMLRANTGAYVLLGDIVVGARTAGLFDCAARKRGARGHSVGRSVRR
jgi:hypothetical protein